MKKYTILIDRTSYASAEVCIMAENEEIALEEAHKMARNIDFNDKEQDDSEYETTIIDD
jgi:hypothetical protein